MLLVMAVGYALFSETITINGTATAKGEFDMTVECIKGLDSEAAANAGVEFEPEGGYKNDSCSVSGNTMTYNVEFEYPGARRYFTAKITNTGTIDAIFADDATYQTKICSDNDEDGNFSDDECNIREEYVENLIAYSYDVYGFKRANGVMVDVDNATEEDMAEFIASDGSGYLIKPGASIYVLFTPEFFEHYRDLAINKKFNLKTTKNYTFTFRQPTAN